MSHALQHKTAIMSLTVCRGNLVYVRSINQSEPDSVRHTVRCTSNQAGLTGRQNGRQNTRQTEAAV